MLLYQHARGHYLAVTPSLRFPAGAGYKPCFEGRNVPDIICNAFVREHGGNIVKDDDVIELNACSARRRGLTMRSPSTPHFRRRA